MLNLQGLSILKWARPPLSMFQAYGGLRGAVAFCLVAMLNRNTLEHKNMFETTTLAVIIFTVFIQVTNLFRYPKWTMSGKLNTLILEWFKVFQSRPYISL